MTKHHTTTEHPYPAHLRPEFVVAVKGQPVRWTDSAVDAAAALAEHPGAVIYAPRLDPDLAFGQLVDRDPEGYRAWLAGRVKGPDLSVLFERFDKWQSRRQALSEAEASGDFPYPGDWHDSDDEAVDLLVALVDLLRQDQGR